MSRQFNPQVQYENPNHSAFIWDILKKVAGSARGLARPLLKAAIGPTTRMIGQAIGDAELGQDLDGMAKKYLDKYMPSKRTAK